MMLRGVTRTWLPASTDEEEGEENIPRYPIAFTEVSSVAPGAGLATATRPCRYTAIVGEAAHFDPGTDIIKAIEARLYILSLSPQQMNARAYEGLATFYQSEGIYFTVVFPSEHLLPEMDPALRWRFRVAFEYPRRKKKGFLLPTLSKLPFACCLLSEGERGRMEHLCPPIPIARYIPEEFGYDRTEMEAYLQSEAQRQKHLEQLYPVIEAIFQRTTGDLGHYLPMRKELIPEQYRDYDLLYDGQTLGGW